MSPRVIAHLALFTVATFYAGNYLVAKHIMNEEHIAPLGFVLLRISVATVLFWLVSLFAERQRIDRKDLGLFVLCGLTGAAINQSFFFLGLELTTPVHASLILTTSPILVLLFSFLILKQRITPRMIGGILLGCAGAVVLMTLGKEVVGSPDYLLGDFMVFVNATSYALYLVLVKRLISKYAPITVIKWVFTFGLIAIFPFGVSDLGDVDWSAFTPGVWLGVAYVLICVTFLAYLLNIFALQRVSPATVGFYIYLQPLLASMLSISLGVETLSVPKVVAGILIFLGVFLVSEFRLSPSKSKESQK